MNNDRSIINEEPGEDEESSATQESLPSPVRENTLPLQKRRILVELNTEECSPMIREVACEDEEDVSHH